MILQEHLQLMFHPSNNEAQQHICNITSHFVAPWARGHGLAKTMIDKAELQLAKKADQVVFS